MLFPPTNWVKRCGDLHVLICSSKIICIFFIKVHCCPFSDFQKLQPRSLILIRSVAYFQQLPSPGRGRICTSLAYKQGSPVLSHDWSHVMKPSSRICVAWARWARMEHMHVNSHTAKAKPSPLHTLNYLGQRIQRYEAVSSCERKDLTFFVCIYKFLC